VHPRLHCMPRRGEGPHAARTLRRSAAALSKRVDRVRPGDQALAGFGGVRP
jgi:hypothetical protein